TGIVAPDLRRGPHLSDDRSMVMMVMVTVRAPGTMHVSVTVRVIVRMLLPAGSCGLGLICHGVARVLNDPDNSHHTLHSSASVTETIPPCPCRRRMELLAAVVRSAGTGSIAPAPGRGA